MKLKCLICCLWCLTTLLGCQTVASRDGTQRVDDIISWLEKAPSEEHLHEALAHLRQLDDPHALPGLWKLLEQYRSTEVHLGCEDIPPSSWICEAILHIEGGVRFRRHFKESGTLEEKIEACSAVITERREAVDRWQTEWESRRLILGGPGVPADIKDEVQFWAAAEQRAVDWLLKQDNPHTMGALCRVATRGKVKKHLRAQGRKARPYLVAECKSGRYESTSACLILLGELADNADIPFVGRFLYAGKHDGGSNLGDAASMALPFYREDALPLLRKAILDADNKMAVRRAACALWRVGGEKAEALLRDALAHQQRNSAVDAETIRVLRHYLSKLQEKAEPLNALDSK